MEPDAISTVYSFSQCALIIKDFDGSRSCMLTETVSQETVPFVPNFNYNYQVSTLWYVFECKG